jgi:UDP-N-acetylglucosamine 4,6-dehydratase/5-epimerase
MTTILVTGGAGSLGKIVCEKLLTRYKVRAMDINESELASMNYDERTFTPIYGDIRDYARVNFAAIGCDYIIHTAAMKNLVVTEKNIPEINKTNILGTENVMEAAIAQKVKAAVMMGTDKAVDSCSAYGVSKSAAEWIWHHGGQITDKTRFFVVRSGNFWKSSGNVFEIWDKLYAQGKPLPLTDKRMMRYFIKTEDVADLLINSLQFGRTGDILIPEMQEYNLYELLTNLYPNAKIEITGSRSGERLAHNLVAEDESLVSKCDGYSIYRKGV